MWALLLAEPVHAVLARGGDVLLGGLAVAGGLGAYVVLCLLAGVRTEAAAPRG